MYMIVLYGNLTVGIRNLTVGGVQKHGFKLKSVKRDR